MIFAGGAVLVVAVALHIAWIGRMARDRGRNVPAWILCGLMAGAVGLRLGAYVVDAAAEAEGTFVAVMATMAPFPMTLACMLVVAIVLWRMPTQVTARREWKVTSAKTGDATLMIERDAIEIRWEGRTDTIARGDLRSAVPDGESVRVTWATGEALLIPMMSPQTRQGRIRQSEMIAQLIAPRAPG